MKRISIILIPILLFLLGCSITASSGGSSSTFFFSTNRTTGQFNSDGHKVWNDEFIHVGFINPDQAHSFTVTMWKGGGFHKQFVFSEIILPGNVFIAFFKSGEYSISVKKGVDRSYENRIIFWDEGDFVINGKSVDVKVDTEELWKRLGGGESQLQYKYRF